LEILWFDLVISSTWPGIRPVKSGIRPETGYKKRPDVRCIPSYV
jgi:hypothetical protein